MSKNRPSHDAGPGCRTSIQVGQELATALGIPCDLGPEGVHPCQLGVELLGQGFIELERFEQRRLLLGPCLLVVEALVAR